MTVLKASEAHVPRDILNKVAYNREVVIIERYNKAEAVIISKADYEHFQMLEDLYLAQLSDEAKAKMKKAGHKPIPYEKLRKEAGL